MKIELKNYMETLVFDKLDEIINDLNCCKCEKCRMDIACHALNRLPPKYVASYEGQVFSKYDTLSVQYEADLVSAIYQAAKIVGENPHHSENEKQVNNCEALLQNILNISQFYIKLNIKLGW